MKINSNLTNVLDTEGEYPVESPRPAAMKVSTAVAVLDPVSLIPLKLNVTLCIPTPSG